MPVLISLVCLPLAYGAAPRIPLMGNLVAQLLFLVLATTLILAFFALALRWGWQARYYGISIIFGASISLFSVVPLLTLVIYGSLVQWLKVSLLVLQVISHVVWCRKFSVLYKNVFENDALCKVMYEEESDAVYYMRNGDQYLLDKYFKFSQMPPDRYFAIFIVLALALVPMMGSVRDFAGIPFPHVFLAVAMVPVSWMSFGFAFRGYLVCYRYPAKIRRATGKEVLVDAASRHKAVDKKMSSAKSSKRNLV
ncbi:hypothetical protein [Massilia sp. 9I]|uniref:hypothetical protein n=1 Tax=Massilia sp. 9I TaxID=2653152 RepID=UPI00135A61E7|nr:hypothetical protein [Massilia sp. 9I]